MNVHDAIDQACASTGINPPRSYRVGHWEKTDTLSGKSGKGDGRLIVDEAKVTAWNWQTGQKETVWLKDEMTPVDRRKVAERIEKDNREKRERAARAAEIAGKLLAAAELKPHAYLARKGFPNEQVHVIQAKAVAQIGGAYLVPEGGKSAILLPARHGHKISSAQLIWEDGAKKFLAGGEMGGASHRIARGSETWLCEGFATALSIRTALKGLNRSATVVCCFSASNIATVSLSIEGRCFIAADSDKPLEQFGWIGTGEHYAKIAGKPYVMPPGIGTDFNDMHAELGIFAIQKLVATFLRGAGR